jgi:hypothetical protein
MGKAVDEFISLKRPRHRSRDLGAQAGVGATSASCANPQFKARRSLTETQYPSFQPTFAGTRHYSCCNLSTNCFW